MIIKNLLSPGSPQTFGGLQMDGGQEYIIPETELPRFRSDSNLLAALSSNPPTASIDDKTGSDAASILLDKSRDPVVTAPFHSKILEGKNIFRRKHGITKVCPGQSETVFEFVVPYDVVKINQLEIVNSKAGDTVDLIVCDTPQGHVQLSKGVPPESVVPSAFLNQFGFDVAMPDGFFRDKSEYDADLIKDMKVVITYKNNGVAEIVNGINIVFHEITEA